MSLRALGYPVSWRRPFERSVDRERLRQRVLAFSGLWFLLGGLLAALGFAAVLQVTFAVLLVIGVSVGVLGSYAATTCNRGCGRPSSIERPLRLLRPGSETSPFGDAQTLQTRVRKTATAAAHRTRVLLARGGRSAPRS